MSYYCTLAKAKPLQNVTFFRQARKAKMLTSEIHRELLLFDSLTYSMSF